MMEVFSFDDLGQGYDIALGEGRVATTLVIGGVIMLWLEWRRPLPSTTDVRQLSFRQALGIGLAQVLSLIPGTSRAAATILGNRLEALLGELATFVKDRT